MLVQFFWQIAWGYILQSLVERFGKYSWDSVGQFFDSFSILVESQLNMLLEYLWLSLHVSWSVLCWNCIKPAPGPPWWNSLYISAPNPPFKNNGRCSWNFLWQFLEKLLLHDGSTPSCCFMDCILKVCGTYTKSFDVSLLILY